MKKIETNGTVFLNHEGTRYEFFRKKSYTVSDEVAAAPYLQGHLLSCVDVVDETKKPKKKAAKK